MAKLQNHIQLLISLLIVNCMPNYIPSLKRTIKKSRTIGDLGLTVNKGTAQHSMFIEAGGAARELVILALRTLGHHHIRFGRSGNKLPGVLQIAPKNSQTNRNNRNKLYCKCWTNFIINEATQISKDCQIYQKYFNKHLKVLRAKLIFIR